MHWVLFYVEAHSLWKSCWGQLTESFLDFAWLDNILTRFCWQGPGLYTTKGAEICFDGVLTGILLSSHIPLQCKVFSWEVVFFPRVSWLHTHCVHADLAIQFYFRSLSCPIAWYLMFCFCMLGTQLMKLCQQWLSCIVITATYLFELRGTKLLCVRTYPNFFSMIYVRLYFWVLVI